MWSVQNSTWKPSVEHGVGVDSVLKNSVRGSRLRSVTRVQRARECPRVRRVSAGGPGASARASLAAPARARAPPCLSAAAGAPGAASLRRAGGRAGGRGERAGTGWRWRRGHVQDVLQGEQRGAGREGGLGRLLSAPRCGSLRVTAWSGEPRQAARTVAIVTGRGWGAVVEVRASLQHPQADRPSGSSRTRCLLRSTSSARRKCF